MLKVGDRIRIKKISKKEYIKDYKLNYKHRGWKNATNFDYLYDKYTNNIIKLPKKGTIKKIAPTTLDISIEEDGNFWFRYSECTKIDNFKQKIKFVKELL